MAQITYLRSTVGRQASSTWNAAWSGPSIVGRLVAILILLAVLALALVIIVPLAVLGLVAAIVFAVWRGVLGLFRNVSRTDGQGRHNVKVRQAAPTGTGE
jgi:hypothetical protein